MKELITKAHKSKTLIFSYLLAMLGVVELQFGTVRHLIPPDYQGLVLIGIGMVTAVLRLATTQPLQNK